MAPNFLIPERQFNPAEPEMIDRTEMDGGILQDDLRNLRVINKYFGGLRAVRKSLTSLLAKTNGAETHILDLATGSADQPLAILKLAEQNDRNVRITAVDKNPKILNVAREHIGSRPEIKLEQQDVLALPYAARSFDIVLCSLAIHHFSQRDAIHLLREMRRLSRIGFIVNDLKRSWPAAWLTWIYTHLTSRNPMTLNDSYVSVLRAFTASELADMARQAGVRTFEIKKYPFFRLVLIGED